MNKLARILVPGLVLQGVVIGGGYATGRELVEYFLRFGMHGAWSGLFLVALIWSTLFALAFVFAKLTGSYDYGGFSKSLLGRAQYAFDVILISLMLIIVAVMCSAAGELAANAFGLEPISGSVALAILIIFGVMFPASWLSKLIAVWSVVLYSGYAAVMWVCLGEYGTEITHSVKQGRAIEGWPLSAAGYAAYNLAAIPAVLFTLSSLKNSREACYSGLLAGGLAVLPCFMMTFILAGFLPDILDSPVPVLTVLDGLSSSGLALFMHIAILGTFWQTGVGSLNALNDRIVSIRRPAFLPIWLRPMVASVFIALAWYIGNQFGVVTLVSKGYGYLTFGFIGLLILPLLTIGLKRVVLDSVKN